MPTVLITGGSSGLGLALYEEFERREWIAMRPSRSILNMGELKSIASYCRQVIERQRQFDCIINCAAMAQGNPNDLYMVNALGPWALADGLWSRIVTGGCIVNITSADGATWKANMDRPAYSVSKAALNHITRLLSKRGEITVIGYDPGVFRSRMNPDCDVDPKFVAADLFERIRVGITEFSGCLLGEKGMMPW